MRWWCCCWWSAHGKVDKRVSADSTAGAAGRRRRGRRAQAAAISFVHQLERHPRGERALTDRSSSNVDHRCDGVVLVEFAPSPPVAFGELDHRQQRCALVAVGERVAAGEAIAENRDLGSELWVELDASERGSGGIER